MRWVNPTESLYAANPSILLPALAQPGKISRRVVAVVLPAAWPSAGALSSGMCGSSDDCRWPQVCIDDHCHTPARGAALRPNPTEGCCIKRDYPGQSMLDYIMTPGPVRYVGDCAASNPAPSRSRVRQLFALMLGTAG